MKRTIAVFAVSLLTLATLYAQDALHQKGTGVNLRILDDNIWSFMGTAIPQGWADLGADPTPATRFKGYQRLIGEWKPDILCFQEYTTVMNGMMYPWIQTLNYAALDVEIPENAFVWTPVFYNTEVLEPVYSKYVLYTPEEWSDCGSKSFESAVFVHKETGCHIAVINTHLWWKREKIKAGSDMARASQTCLMTAEADIIAREFPDCAIFITGDMNCRENSKALQIFFDNGFKPCYSVATEYGDRHSGYHKCDGNGFAPREDEPSRNRTDDAIDHCLVRDTVGVVEVKRFDCVMDEYTLKLTDHYPNIVDVEVKRGYLKNNN